MKKLLTHVALASLLLSCSTSRTPVTAEKPVNKAPDRAVATADPKTEVSEEAPKTEYTHEIAEADADDLSIKQAVGVSEIDEEIDTEQKIPYAPGFLTLRNTKRMQFWVEYFTQKQRDRFQRFINNGQEYRHHIEQIFAEHGLPKELYFVGLIESGYYLGARSHAKAVGPWQFVKGTGTRYGLRVTPEIDERQDLFKASRAAALYFKDLHNIFSSWELALSAYNAGENGIIRRIMKYGTRDFYSLSRNKQLPSETINYVPKVLAAMHVVNNAEKYGFVIPKKHQRLFDKTELQAMRKNLPLHVVARKLNVDLTLLKKLNPELKRDATPKYLAGTYYLRVPKGQNSPDTQEDMVAKNIAKPESRKELNRRTASAISPEVERVVATIFKPKLHRVKTGDTLVGISKKYHLNARLLAEVNRLKPGQKLKNGQTLSLNTDFAEEAKSTGVRLTHSPIVYRIRPGDNLKELARIFNVKVSEIRNANHLKRANVAVGQKIVMPDTQKGIYTVKHGDHLFKVARELNQPVELLVKLNQLKRKQIYPGQKIIVNMD